MELKPIFENKEIYPKGWGYELWICNNDKYCLKKLIFNKSSKFSMHYHLKKDETWYIEKGNFIFNWIDTIDATINTKELKEGDTVRIPPGMPHQLQSIDNDGIILETSTQHFEYDNYRVMKGDSQK